MSLICDKGILLSVKKYNDRCSRMVLFSENNGLIQIFGKTARGSAAYQVYDFLDFRCDYVDSYNYRNLEISVLRSYLGNVFCNRLFMSIFNSAVAIALTLRERGNIGNLYRVFQNMLFLTEFSHVNPLPYYIDFLLNVLDFSGIRLSMDYCCAEGAGGDSYYISPRTGNCVSREVGEKYKQRLFLIPKSFKSYSEDIEDISSAIDIAHYFLRRTFAENCTAQKNRMIDIFREILLQEIKRQGSMNTGNCQPYGPRTRQTRSDTRS